MSETTAENYVLGMIVKTFGTWNRACFFKALPSKGMAKKGKKTKGGTKSKQKVIVPFFFSADGEKGKSINIWKSKNS